MALGRGAVRGLVALLSLLAPTVAGATVEPAPACADLARQRAGELLAWHLVSDAEPAVRPEIEAVVIEQPSIANPAWPAQRLRVLEVWGSAYKARYRMQFLFAPTPAVCALVGEEILEFGAF